MTSQDNDITLWASFKKGDVNAFTEIYQRHSKRLYAYGLRMNGDNEMVSDALQNTFVKIWSNRERIAVANNVKYFLISSFRNNLLTLISKTKNTESLEDFGEETFIMDFTLESEYIKKENINIQSEKLNKALNKLTAKQKEIVYLRFFEELNYDQISEIMNISVKGAYKLSARALLNLQTLLNISKSSLLILLSAYKLSNF